jgi:hypothetical protein
LGALSITEARVLADPAEMLGNLDAPSIGEGGDTYALRLSGWIAGRDQCVIAVEAATDLEQLRTIALAPREDVARHLAANAPEIAVAATGFDFRISVIGMPNPFKVALNAVLDGGRTVPFATIEGRHERVRPHFRPRLKPLMLLNIGRSGTTLLMELLRQHPQLVIDGEQPFETRAAQYWAHLLRVLSEPPSSGATPTSTFVSDPAALATFPFASAGTSSIADAFGTEAVGRTADYILESIDHFYSDVARRAGRDQTGVYFAEKTLPAGFIPGTLFELYEEARGVLLVRDPRDVIASWVAFDPSFAGQGDGKGDGKGDGADAADSMVEHMATWLEHLLGFARSSPRCLIVRYEDLVTEPARHLSRILEHCGLDASHAAVTAMLSDANPDGPLMAAHRTSASSGASIGRWKADLSDVAKRRATRRLGSTLTELGYEV